MKRFEYNGTLYDTIEQVDTAIDEKYASDFNNKETPQHIFI